MLKKSILILLLFFNFAFTTATSDPISDSIDRKMKKMQESLDCKMREIKYTIS